MSVTAIEPSAYPVDAFQVPTVLSIGAHDQTSDVEVIVHRHHGCATHQVITSIITDQTTTNLPPSLIASQLQFSDQMTIKSIKIGFLGSLETVEEVQTFLKHPINQKCPVVLNLNGANQWDDDALEAAIDSILPFCSILAITYDVVNGLCISQNLSEEDVVETLLKMGPKAIVVHYEDGQRYVASNSDGDDEAFEMQYIQLPDQHPASSVDEFSAAIAAHLAQDTLSLDRIIAHSHSYSTVEEFIHLPFPHVPPTLSFTQELWSSVDDIYKRTLALPFVNKMLHSTLDEHIYDYYIIQDYYFFLDRGHMLNGLVNHCTNDDKVLEFLKMQLDKNAKYVKTILAENNLSPCDENIIKKMPACMNYTKLMRELGECRGNLLWIQGLIALLPCPLVYAKVGDWMIASGIQPTVKRYADFIDTYRDQERRDRLIHFLNLVNRVVNSCSHEQRQKLKKLFQKVCEYEYAFWNDAYRYGMQYRNDMMEANVEREENELYN